MSLIDTDSMVEALSPPQIKIAGEVYTGRLLSFVEAEPLRQAFRNSKGWDETQAAITKICEAMNLPADKVLSLPPGIVGEVVTRFFTDLYRDPTDAETTGPSGSSA